MELPPQRLAVKVPGALDRIALLNSTQRRGVLRQLVHLERDGLAAPGADVHERPPVGRGVGQLDVVLHLDAAIHEGRDRALGRAVLDREVEVALLNLELALRVGERLGRLAVGLDDLVHVDVAPAAGGIVHDLDDGRLAGELAHVPKLRHEGFAAAGFVVRAGGIADGLAVNQQVHAGLLRVLAAADEEGDVFALDLELGRRERAGACHPRHGNELTRPFPRKPSTGIWLGRVPCAGPGPNASPVTFHAPQSSPSKSAISRSPSAIWPAAREQRVQRKIMRWLANPFIKRTEIAARAMLPSSASSYIVRISLTITSPTQADPKCPKPGKAAFRPASAWVQAPNTDATDLHETWARRRALYSAFFIPVLRSPSSVATRVLRSRTAERGLRRVDSAAEGGLPSTFLGRYRVGPVLVRCWSGGGLTLIT